MNDKPRLVRPDIAEALWVAVSERMRFNESVVHLAHYTPEASARKIIASGALWACDATAFDASHFEGDRLEFATEALGFARKAGPPPSGSFRKALRDQLHTPTLPVKVFASCLCVNTDSPHMWQRFGDRGRGVALIFDTRRINPKVAIMAARCIYDRNEQLELLAHLWEKCEAILAEGPIAEVGGPVLTSATALTTLILQAFKAPLLADEQEARYVYIELENQDHGRLVAPDPMRRSIPFVAEGQPSPVTAMRLGPLRSTSLDVETMREWLREIGQDIEVMPSAVSVDDFLRLYPQTATP